MSETGIDLVFEVGCEEIPHDLLELGVLSLKNHLRAKLEEPFYHELKIETYGTPRRLVGIVRDLPEEELGGTVTVWGPPARIAVDDHGIPTKQGEGFAKRIGVPFPELEQDAKEKGGEQYLIHRVDKPKRPTKDVLAELLPEVIKSIRWAKAMHWADGQGPFVRPIRWICAVLDGKHLDFEFAGVQAGGLSRGHRFMAPEPFAVKGPDDYLKTLKAAKVLVDMDARTQSIREQLKTAGTGAGGTAIADESLIAATAAKTEWPVAVVGTFDKKYLEVPREVLITSMGEHQDDFGVEDKNGELLPAFINFADNEANDLSVIAHGNERVLRARLEDARFFFATDKKKKLADYAPKLESFLFQKDLGSMSEKVARVAALAEKIAPQLGAEPAHAKRAASLSKCDLVTNMVYEFPELQGIMGGKYARLSGEPEAVAHAIAEHYLPGSAMGELPQTPEGKAVAIADKLDTICGIFGVGLIPSGSQDPYALRRAGAGIVRMLAEAPTQLSLQKVVKMAMGQLADKIPNRAPGVDLDVIMFLKGRMEFSLREEDLRPDVVSAVVVSAVLEAEFGSTNADMYDLSECARALNALTSEAGFDDLMTGCKRIVNIIPKGFNRIPVDVGQLTVGAERELYEAFEKVGPTISNRTLPAADRLAALSALRPQIDKFFDDVMVMDDDMDIRTRRLSMLDEIAETFRTFADFSQVVVN